MTRPVDPILIVPARLASVRLPDKPLADIHGLPMIVHVWRRAVQAGLGPVVVAAADPPIAKVIADAGGDAVLTDPDHPSGSDRIFEALSIVDPGGRHDAVVNVQGDLPAVAPGDLRTALDLLCDGAVDIGTLCAEIRCPDAARDPNVVKAVAPLTPERAVARALYFTRAPAPHGDGGPFYHHVGLYAYRRAALARFVRLAPGVLERRERLEQLRALEAGMRIDVARIDDVPLGVDTPADLARARALLAP